MEVVDVNECNFIPDRYREEKAFRRAIRLRVSGLGAIFCIMVLWWVAHGHRLSSAEAMQSEISLQLDQVEANAAQKRTMDSQLAELRSRRHLIEKLSGRTSLILVFSELSRRQPDMVVLTAVSVECSSLAAYTTPVATSAVSGVPSSIPLAEVRPEVHPEHAVMRSKLKLSGIAATLPDIIQFAAALEQSPLFDRVNMRVGEPAVWAGHPAERFELTCELLPEEGHRP